MLLDKEALLKRLSKIEDSIIIAAENSNMTDWTGVYTNGNI